MKIQGIVPTKVVRISVAEASKSFAALLQQVRLERTEFELEDQGRIVAMLSPVEPVSIREQEEICMLAVGVLDIVTSDFSAGSLFEVQSDITCCKGLKTNRTMPPNSSADSGFFF